MSGVGRKQLPHLTTRTCPLELSLRVRLGLPEAGDPISGFPLAAFLEDFDALKALHDVSFAAQSGRGAQAAML